MIALGIDLGSSSVKVNLFSIDSKKSIARVTYPEEEMEINSPEAGWAEQNPEDWWQYTKTAIAKVCEEAKVASADIKAIGIAYQMHGLVCLDKQNNLVTPAIIWCDSRALSVGEQAFEKLGSDYCFNHLLNSPGNFTAAKLLWLQEKKPEVYKKIATIMLPGDYIAMKLSDECSTTKSGLSEGIFWDFLNQKPAEKLLDTCEIARSLIPTILNNFSHSLRVGNNAAEQTGINVGTPICYRAGDQPNNAFSLNVCEPGELAASGGTSAVLYAVAKNHVADTSQKVNSFLHISQQDTSPIGVLMCLSGGGRAYAWLRELISQPNQPLDYSQLNQLAEQSPAGALGLRCLPFGNGAERVLNSQNKGAHFCNLDFNRHARPHLVRATIEGIAFAMVYGFEHLQSLSCNTHVIRASDGNLFQNDIFSQTIADLTQCSIELINTDGSEGASRGAAIGAGLLSKKAAFEKLDVRKTFTPNSHCADIQAAYTDWLQLLTINNE